MRLANRSVRASEYRHPLFNEDLPPLTESQIPELLSRLRAGDNAARDEAILGYVRLSMQIVGRYLAVMRSDRLSDELVSAAIEGIVDAVSKVMAGEMNHDNLTGYVVAYVHRYISRTLEKRPIVRVPRVTNHDRKKKGLDPLRADRVDFSDPGIVRETVKSGDFFDIEIKEILDKVIQNDEERQILDYRKEGRTDAEIADLMELSKTTVFVMRKGIETRFLELFYG